MKPTLAELEEENEELRDLLDFFTADISLPEMERRHCTCPNGSPPCSYCTDVRPLEDALERVSRALNRLPWDDVWSLVPPTKEGTYCFYSEETGEEITEVHLYSADTKPYFACHLGGRHKRVNEWHKQLTNPKWKKIYDPSIRIRDLERKLELQIKENLRLRK